MSDKEIEHRLTALEDTDKQHSEDLRAIFKEQRKQRLIIFGLAVLNILALGSNALPSIIPIISAFLR